MSTFSAHFIKYASDMSHLLGTDGKLSHNALPFSQQISLETASTTNTEIYPGYHLSPFLKKKNQPTLLLKCMFIWCCYTGVCFEYVFLEFLVVVMDNFLFYFEIQFHFSFHLPFIPSRCVSHLCDFLANCLHLYPGA